MGEACRKTAYKESLGSLMKLLKSRARKTRLIPKGKLLSCFELLCTEKSEKVETVANGNRSKIKKRTNWIYSD
jgi:hypothetical protein